MSLFYYIGPYVKRGWGPDPVEADLFYAPPDGAIGSLDLRVDPSRDGNALFVFKDAYDVKGYTALNTGMDAAVEKLGDAQAVIRDLYGVELESGGTLLDGLWRMLTLHADGVQVPNPLMPTHKGVTELWIANTLVRAETFKGKSDPAWSQVQRVLAANYTAMRADAAAKDGDTTLAQKWLGAMELKFKVPYTDIAPVALQEVGPLKPTTAIEDTFNRSNSGNLGTSSDGDWSWTETLGNWEIVSNAAEDQTWPGSSFARAEKDLSSDDHEAWFYINADTADSPGVMLRYAGAANTGYACGRDSYNDKEYIGIFDVGSYTAIGTPGSASQDAGEWKGSVDGSTLKVYFGGSLLRTESHSTITGNTRTGFCNYRNGQKPRLDYFGAQDLVAGVSVPAVLAANMRGGFDNARGGFVN